MSLSQSFIVFLFRALTSAVFRIHDAELKKAPAQGPLILMTNHINIFEIPIIYSHLQPRPLHGLVLADRWKNPVVAWGLDVCGTIPLQRGGMNLESMRRALAVLEKGEMLIISPEGTRSGDGVLQEAFPGIAILAAKSGAPLLPVGYYGGEAYKENLTRLRRTDFNIAIGKPFRIKPGSVPGREARQQMADEIMYRLAAILPERYRGRYADLSKATQEYTEEYGS